MSVEQSQNPVDPSGAAGTRQILEMNEVGTQVGAVELGDRDLLVSGDLQEGAVVRGNGEVSVKGHISGSLLHRCVLEVGGDVRVDGDVKGARIRCRSLAVGGLLEQVEVVADRGLEVGGGMKASEVQVGTWGGEHTEVKTLVRDILHFQGDLKAMEGRMKMASRRFLRDYGQIDIQFGNIISKTRWGIEVDLKDLYRILRDRSEADVDRGVQEFFFKVIVGALTRSNRVYVSQNTSRQNVFLKLVSELREHILEVRTRDKLQARMEALGKRRKVLADSLLSDTPWGVLVRGQVGSETVIRLAQFRNQSGGPEGEMELDRRSCQMRVGPREAEEFVVNLTSLDGFAFPPERVSVRDLSSIRVYLRDPLPAWEGLPDA